MHTQHSERKKAAQEAKAQAKDQQRRERSEKKQAVANNVVQSLLGALDVANVEDITAAHLASKKVKGKHLDALLWLKRGKGLQGTVSAQRAAVAAALGIE